MPPARVRWVRGRNGVAAWVIPVATQGMGRGILFNSCIIIFIAIILFRYLILKNEWSKSHLESYSYED